MPESVLSIVSSLTLNRLATGGVGILLVLAPLGVLVARKRYGSILV